MNEGWTVYRWWWCFPEKCHVLRILWSFWLKGRKLMLWSTSFVHCKCTTVYWCRLSPSKTVCSYKYSISSAATNREWKCAKNIINDMINLFLWPSLSILVITNHTSFRVLFDKIASIYFICVLQKIHLLFFNNCQKLPDCNDFWHVKSWENLTTKILHIVHLACQM